MPTVLICDDHPTFLSEAGQLLSAEGFIVLDGAADGATAILLASQRRPDVLLLDIGLPDIDGFAVAERVAALEPAICVILTSSRDEAVFGGRVREAAARGFVRKDELSGAAIRRLMGPMAR